VRDRPPPAQQLWLGRVVDWIGGIVHDLLRRIDRALDGHRPLETALGDILIGLAFGVFGLAVFLLVRSFARSTARRTRPGAPPGGTDVVAERGAALRAAADAAARAGRYRAAAALLFVAAERELDAAGRVAYDPARTPGELLALVRDPVFDILAGDAVVALFAADEPAADLFARMSANYDRLFGALTA
jgi:hypothetical protein